MDPYSVMQKYTKIRKGGEEEREREGGRGERDKRRKRSRHSTTGGEGGLVRRGRKKVSKRSDECNKGSDKPRTSWFGTVQQTLLGTNHLIITYNISNYFKLIKFNMDSHIFSAFCQLLD